MNWEKCVSKDIEREKVPEMRTAFMFIWGIWDLIVVAVVMLQGIVADWISVLGTSLIVPGHKICNFSANKSLFPATMKSLR